MKEVGVTRRTKECVLDCSEAVGEDTDGRSDGGRRALALRATSGVQWHVRGVWSGYEDVERCSGDGGVGVLMEVGWETTRKALCSHWLSAEQGWRALSALTSHELAPKPTPDDHVQRVSSRPRSKFGSLAWKCESKT